MTTFLYYVMFLYFSFWIKGFIYLSRNAKTLQLVTSKLLRIQIEPYDSKATICLLIMIFFFTFYIYLTLAYFIVDLLTTVM